jgi:hypothetical protein
MTNKITNALLVLAIGGGLTFAGSAVAQTSGAPNQPAAGAGVSDPGHPRVNQVDNRLQNQKDRLEQGVKDGSLTKEQARQLNRHDQRITRQENRDMAQNGGHLTKQQQNQINKELNKNSREIHKAKQN